MVPKVVLKRITQLQEVQAQMGEKQSELSELKAKHLAFWEDFQKECGATTRHENVTKMSDWRKASGGYICKYCLHLVLGWDETWLKKVDLYKRETFTNWLNCDKSKWAPEKIAAFERAKREISEYFAKAEPLEQAIVALKKEEEKIKTPLEETWEMLDKALGKDTQRQREEKYIRQNYEQRIRNIEYAHRPPPPFGDPDAFRD